MTNTEIETPAFSFTGNHICLDFVNTIEDRPSSNPRELLNSYDDLTVWGEQAHLLTENEAQRLRKEAAHHPIEAENVRKRAIELREALYQIFLARAEDVAPNKADLNTLNQMLSEAMAQARLVPNENGFTWDWSGKEQALDSMLWAVVRTGADLLTSEEIDDVRICAADDCNWLFLDTSKNHSRRWCDMKSCGNRAKARKHYSQKKQAT